MQYDVCFHFLFISIDKKRSFCMLRTCGSDGKESACNAGDLGLILEWQTTPVCVCVSLSVVASILAWRIPWTEEPVGYSPLG